MACLVTPVASEIISHPESRQFILTNLFSFLLCKVVHGHDWVHCKVLLHSYKRKITSSRCLRHRIKLFVKLYDASTSFYIWFCLPIITLLFCFQIYLDYGWCMDAKYGLRNNWMVGNWEMLMAGRFGVGGGGGRSLAVESNPQRSHFFPGKLISIV